MKKKKLYALPTRCHTRNQLTTVSGEISVIKDTQLRAEKLITEHARIIRHMAKQFHNGHESESVRWQMTVNMVRMVSIIFFMNALFTTTLFWLMR